MFGRLLVSLCFPLFPFVLVSLCFPLFLFPFVSLCSTFPRGARCPPVRSSLIVFVFYECLDITGPRIAGFPYRLIADATLASRIGRPSPPGAPARGRDARSFRSRRDPDARYRSRSRIRDPPADTVRGALLSESGGVPGETQRTLPALPVSPHHLIPGPPEEDQYLNIQRGIE